MQRKLAIALGVAFLAAMLAIAPSFTTRGEPAASCPQGTHADSARSARIVRELRFALGRLSHDADAVRLEGMDLANAAVCHAETSELREPDLIVLDRRLGERAAAARAAHLLLHARIAPPWPSAPHLPCAERVRGALAAETRARALEVAVAAALGTSVQPERSPAELSAAYAQRCAREHR